MTPVLTDTARVLVTSTSTDGIVVKVPGTQYQLSFLPHCPKCAFVAGERVHARFRATALKMHHAKAGGIFVEPSEGPGEVFKLRGDHRDRADWKDQVRKR